MYERSDSGWIRRPVQRPASFVLIGAVLAIIGMLRTMNAIAAPKSSAQNRLEARKVHCLEETIVDRLAHERMVRDGDVAAG